MPSSSRSLSASWRRRLLRPLAAGALLSALALVAACTGRITPLETSVSMGSAKNTLGDKEAPSVPDGLSASEIMDTSFRLEWNDATDNVGVIEYRVYQDGALKGSTSGTSFIVSGLAATTSYAMTVRALDEAGNASALSAVLHVTTTEASSSSPPPPPPPGPDTQAPSVAVGAPANGATVATTFTVSATATDNVGVAGVQFFLDGRSVGAEMTAPPYAYTVTGAGAGSHTLRAHARDAAGNGADSSTVTVTVSTTPPPPSNGVSIEFGRTSYGPDHAIRNDAPAGGTLFSVWTKIPDPGSSYPWKRGNMDDYVLYGDTWHLRCLTGNSSATSATAASYNANSMLFVDPSNTWVNDYSYYYDPSIPSEAEVRGWVWAAWQVIVDLEDSTFTMRQWLKFGIDGDVLAAGESQLSFDDIRAVLVSKRGFTQAQADAWIPGDATHFQVGKDNGYLIHARMAATSAAPTLDALDAIARANAADTTAWADYELDWVNGGAPNLADRSGNGRDLAVDTGGMLHPGPAGPAF